MDENNKDYVSPAMDNGDEVSPCVGVAFAGAVLVAYAAAVWSVAGIINYALVYNVAGGGNVAAYYNVTTKGCKK